MNPKIVLNYWRVMNSNDFTAASLCLTEDHELAWPQSSERLLGRKNFVAVNTQYPAAGLWQFKVNSCVADADVVVTDTSITDGEVQARAITFSTVRNGLIHRQIEYWPDDYEAPAWQHEFMEAI